MPVYVYETVPRTEDEQPEQFELFQSIKAEPLRTHPETGKPVRRLVSGGVFIPKNKRIQRSSAGSGCCGGGTCASC
ncbi:MAG: zinc ribbon domain-containing protein [Opitutales bacterium]